MQRIKRKKAVLQPSLDMLAAKDRIEEPMDFVEGPVSNVRPVLNVQDAIPGIVANPNNLPEMTVDEDGGVHIGNIYIPPAPKPALTFETSGPRLIISRIDIENFKSYAVEQILGPYHQSFTAVVGPNGSGKSNVIDAMLFVFGYRSSKIRSKKISELIHTSSQYLNVKFAKVSVHFCEIVDLNAENYTVVPNSEIIVERTAYKDNTSFYTVNGVRMQFKQVAQLLRQKGIDLDHNRFLILQGEIEEIALMKPKAMTEHETGMLEYLEDIIGTSRFKMPIEMMLIKVEELNDLRKAKLNRVRLVEQEKMNLEPAMRENVRLLQLTNAAIRTRNTLLQKYIYETNKIVERKDHELQELKGKVVILDNKQQEVQRALAEKNAILNASTQKQNLMRTKKNEVVERWKNTKCRLDDIQTSITQAKKKKKTSEQNLEEKRRKLVELELLPERNQKEMEDCKKLLDRHKISIDKLNEEHKELMTNIRNQTKGLEEKARVLNGQLTVINKELEPSKMQMKTSAKRLNAYLSTEVNEMAILEQLKQNYEAATKALEEKTKSHADLEKSRIQLEKELPVAQRTLQTLREEEMTLKMRMTTLGDQLDEAERKMTAVNSRSQVLTNIMEQKRSGRIPGIYGRLGDLGSIDAKYDVAISSSCSTLNHILVENVQTGKVCIQHLKATRGWSSFLILDQQDRFKSVYPRKANYPENVPRLFDLVRMNNEKIKTAFYYALRDTLVATDIDQASRIAYGPKRYRVVTLLGQVIELAGTMAGGGATPKRGLMSTSVTQDIDPISMDRHRQELEAAKERLVQISDEKLQWDTKLSILRNNFSQTTDRLHIEKEEITTLELEVTESKVAFEQQEMTAAACKVNPREKATMETTLKTAQEKFEVVTGKAKVLEEQVKAIKMKIAEVIGSRLDTINNKIKDLNTLMGRISSEYRKLETATSNSKKEASKTRVDITNLETLLTQLDASLESLSNEKRERTLEDKRFQKEIEELDENINGGSGEYSGLQEEIQKLNRKDTKYRSEKIELNVNVERKITEIKESKSKLQTFYKELRTLTLEDPGEVEVLHLTSPDPLEVHSAEELEAANTDELRDRWSAQNGRLEGVKPNLQAILDYKAKEEIYLERVNELDAITKDRNKMRLLHDALKKRRTIDFLAGFNTITSKLKEMYQMITLGGDAELELVDSLDPFTEGIVFSVRPPQKSWKNIANISGGERTLSSLALVFALHYYKPTPLYVMDEIDAALDFKNVSIVANYIKERTRNAQFIIISLRYNMFEVSNRLVGIFKTDDCTKCLVVNNDARLNLPEFAQTHQAIIG